MAGNLSSQRHNANLLAVTPKMARKFLDFYGIFCQAVGVCLRGASCSYDMSPDEDFIIDTLPDNRDIMVVTGLSGHGFKFATALGEVAALFAQNKPSPIDISAFSLSRFAHS